MEMSVGFADKGKDANFYIERGYRVEESELGKVYYPKRNAVKVGKIGIRYEERPWLSSFEIDGLRPAKPQGKNYSRSMQLILQYARAFDGIRRKDVIDLCKLTPFTVKQAASPNCRWRIPRSEGRRKSYSVCAD